MLPKIVSNSEVYCKVSCGALAGQPIAGWVLLSTYAYLHSPLCL